MLRRFTATCAVVLICVCIGYCGKIIRPPAPMFANRYAYHPDGRPPWPRWWIAPPHIDSDLNAAIADYDLNLLVVFLTGDAGITPGRFWFPHPTEDGVVFPAENQEDEFKFFVPRVKDTMIIFTADGRRRDFPLLPGEAERIHPYLDVPNGFLFPVLAEMYAQNHSESLDELAPPASKIGVSVSYLPGNWMSVPVYPNRNCGLVRRDRLPHQPPVHPCTRLSSALLLI